MRHNSELSKEEQICVLTSDDMKVLETYEYEPANDLVKKPANYVQVVMDRVLRKSWKQPIFYDFGHKINTKTLFSMITAPHDAGYTVFAIVSDMGTKNQACWRSLGASPGICNLYTSFRLLTFRILEQTWFPSSANDFFVPGIKHNIQLLATRTISDLLKYTSTSDTSIVFKLSDDHVTVSGPGMYIFRNIRIKTY